MFEWTFMDISDVRVVAARRMMRTSEASLWF